MDKKSKNTLIISIIALALVLVGVTYAYFSARITGLESASTIRLTAGRMGIVYSEGDENVVMNNIYPREGAWVTKTITLTGYNTTDQNMKYRLSLNVTTNEFSTEYYDYLTYDLRVLQSTNGTPVFEKTGVTIVGTGNILLGVGIFTNANNDVHRYELKIYFKDDGYDQNDAQEAVFNAKINVSEYQAQDYQLVYDQTNSRTLTIPDTYTINTANCLASPTLQGDLSNEDLIAFCNGETIEYEEIPGHIREANIDSDLLYEYVRGDPSTSFLITEGIVENLTTKNKTVPAGSYMLDYGQYTYIPILNDDASVMWGAMLPDPYSTAPVTSEVLKSINGDPVTVYDSMFANSYATSIDLASIDSSEVTSMGSMFSNALITSIDLSPLDTSSVTYMSYMFNNSQIDTIDITTFDTSNVTDMSYMFYNAYSSRIDLSNVDLSGKNIRYIIAGFHGEIVLRSTDDLNLICASGSSSLVPVDVTFIIGGNVVETPSGCLINTPPL